ncbi:hypothetical protein MKX03_022980, partial [Papaver bracteatum]
IFAGSPDLIEGRFPQFCNLQSLKLATWYTSRCLAAVSALLKTCPCIESLYLTSVELDFRADKDDGEMELSASSILFHLKRMEIRELKGCDAETKFLELLLMNAPVLEEMVLSFDKSSSPDIAGSPDRLQVAKKLGEKLRSLSRASPSLAMILL